MTTITPFDFESNMIRTVVDKDNNIGFVAKDIAVVLGYERPNNAINAHCMGALKLCPLKTEGGTQKVRIIAEPDVYRLIVKSKLPSAQKFERWIFEEVLPTLRKTGSYSVPKDPKPQVFITGMLLKELRLLAEGNAQLMRSVGIDENQILSSTSRFMESILGIGPTKTLDIPTPPKSQYYTAEALGGKLPIRLSGSEVIKRLVRLNCLLVEYEPSGKCRISLTLKGKKLGGRVFDIGKKYSDGSIIQQIKWQENILELLRKIH
ncbi:BRO family protein [Candidatus Liberibacter asiaticus]|uniref:BRO family protein n=1 Tax=Liberibacter asiaticus TaxID=34021 RepID=UPI00192615CA|nr:BRO family protein [Candidatus Liberibacter asiaticus]